MYIHVPLILFLLASTGESEANLLSRSSKTIVRVASRAHQRAARRSANLARDLRTSFNGIFAVEDSQPKAVANSRMYCVNQPPSFPPPSGNGTGVITNGTSTITFGSTATSGAHHTSSPAAGTSTATGSGPAPTGTSTTSPWKIKNTWQGSTFFDGWNFHTDPPGGQEPTHGNVDYQTRDAAQSAGLMEINSDGHAIMRVETTPQVSGNRKSIRLESKVQFNGSLVILDAVHMPTGCGTWGAFWTNGPTWPYSGEIDIVEGIHDYTNDQTTLHTGPGCTIPTTGSFTSNIAGSVLSTQCDVSNGQNEGCGIRSPMSNSFGAGFNSIGGGVYAMSWDDDGVSIWFFPRNAIPDDISSNNPTPANWGKPIAFFPASSCDPWKIFHDHSIIINTTLCGDWAGSAWGVAGIPGQEQSCAARTGVASCTDFIRQNGNAMSEAYWQIKYVQLYQKP